MLNSFTAEISRVAAASEKTQNDGDVEINEISAAYSVRIYQYGISY